MGLRDFYNRIRGKKEEPTDYQLRRRAVARANADLYGETFMVKKKVLEKRSLGKITDEVKLNEALSRASLKRRLSSKYRGPPIDIDKAYPALVAAYEYVENNLDGEKKAKYEAAILKRARRLQGALWRRADGYGGEHGHEWDPRFIYIKQAEEIRRIADKIEGRSGLETASSLSVMIIGIVSGIFFLSSNITGNVIGASNTITSNIIGVILILIGIVGAFFWFRKK